MSLSWALLRFSFTLAWLYMCNISMEVLSSFFKVFVQSLLNSIEFLLICFGIHMNSWRFILNSSRLVIEFPSPVCCGFSSTNNFPSMYYWIFVGFLCYFYFLNFTWIPVGILRAWSSIFWVQKRRIETCCQCCSNHWRRPGKRITREIWSDSWLCIFYKFTRWGQGAHRNMLSEGMVGKTQRLGC